MPQIQAKIKFLQKIRYHFLDVKIMSLHLKNKKKKQSATPTKNVELSHRTNERWTDNNDLIGPIVCGIQHTMET